MKTPHFFTKRRVVQCVLVGAASIIAVNWAGEYLSEPFGNPVISPDGLYELRYFKGWSFFSIFSLKFRYRSDEVDGYMRLYNAKTGALLKKSGFIRGIIYKEPFWGDDSVYFLGDDEIELRFD